MRTQIVQYFDMSSHCLVDNLPGHVRRVREIPEQRQNLRQKDETNNDVFKEENKNKTKIITLLAITPSLSLSAMRLINSNKISRCSLPVLVPLDV